MPRCCDCDQDDRGVRRDFERDGTDPGQHDRLRRGHQGGRSRGWGDFSRKGSADCCGIELHVCLQRGAGKWKQQATRPVPTSDLGN